MKLRMSRLVKIVALVVVISSATALLNYAGFLDQQQPPQSLPHSTVDPEMTHGNGAPTHSSWWRTGTAASTSDVVLTSIPLASGHKRLESWRRVQRTVDVEESRRVVAGHKALCAAVGAAENEHAAPIRNPTFVVLNVFDSAAADARAEAGHRRIFVAINGNGDGNDTAGGGSTIQRRLCRGGAVIEASLESDIDKVDIDFPVEVVPGLYEFQPFFSADRSLPTVPCA